MADLRAIVEGLGCSSVRTLLNSGNVVFSAPKTSAGTIAARIQGGLEKKLGVSARVMAMSGDELAAVIDANPLVGIADNPSRLVVGILGDAADAKKLTEIAGKDWGAEKIARGRGSAARAVYMWIPGGQIESRLFAAVSKALKDGVTARNWSTMLKLQDMAAGGGP
jgi:uncharacterized protein (DUF1697 family)